MLQGLAVIWAAEMLITCAMIQKPPIQESNKQSEKVSFWSIISLLKTRQFICIFLMTFASIFFGTFIVGSYK